MNSCCWQRPNNVNLTATCQLAMAFKLLHPQGNQQGVLRHLLQHEDMVTHSTVWCSLGATSCRALPPFCPPAQSPCCPFRAVHSVSAGLKEGMMVLLYLSC